ncbi:MAG: TerC/Alx family metal homeostasis membrane protein [Bacteroidales bacterium]|nr:TerC/Alx family metal homeostasis membrane protein [Bacteroidales bacterium]
MHNSGLIQGLFLCGFMVLILGLLVMDLGVFEKKDKIVSFKRALCTTFIWIVLAAVFGLVLRFAGEQMHGIEDKQSLTEIVNQYHGHALAQKVEAADYEKALDAYRKQSTLEYFTGYLIEYSLSIDNIFVMILIFSSFAVPQEYYKRVLMWGILGAMAMRFIFIFAAGALVAKYEWILAVFGIFLIYSAIKMFVQRNKKDDVNPQNNPVVKFFSKIFPVTNEIRDHSFVRKINGRRVITPLLLCLIVIEFTDVLFAVDSIPAIFSVTKDPYIVFFSNIFAILGLRSLFFLVSSIIRMFRFLKVGLSFLLLFIGVKMIIECEPINIDIPIVASLLIIIGILLISILASVLIPEKPHNNSPTIK